MASAMLVWMRTVGAAPKEDSFLEPIVAVSATLAEATLFVSHFLCWQVLCGPQGEVGGPDDLGDVNPADFDAHLDTPGKKAFLRKAIAEARKQSAAAQVHH